MSKEQVIEIMMLLSALESWSFSNGQRMPDYLLERLNDAIDVLCKEALK